MLAFKNKPIPGTVSKMKGCHPCAPESSLFLLLLLTFTSLDSIWGLNFRRTHVTEDQGAIHSRRQWRPLEDCNTSPDFYIALDKGSRVKTDWKFFYKFAVDIVARFRKNPILRISFITFACKGNIINPITSNRVKIQKALDRLKYTIPAGYMLPFNALYKANIQIERLKRLGLHTYSVIILVINNEMKPPEFKVTLKEAQYSRKLSAVIIAIGVGYSKRDQLTQITGKPENTFSSQYTESHLQEAVNMIHQRFCPRLTGVQNRTLCIRGGNTMIVEGYGFDIAGNVENIICRYVYSGKIFKHEKAFTYSSNMIICRTPPSEEVGKAVFIEISLNKGHSYMDGNIFMFTRSCGRTLSTTLKTKPTRGKPTTTTMKTTTRPTTMTTATMMTATTTITTAELGTATAIATPMTTTTPNVLPTHVAIRLTITTIPHITPETPMISNFIFVPIGLALLFAVLLFGCLRQLCCPPPVKEPPVPLLPPVTVSPAGDADLAGLKRPMMVKQAL
ncbi:anthrax toxin receptor-like [Thomomys bottae]